MVHQCKGIKKFLGKISVADPDAGSRAFLAPGSGMGEKSRSGYRMIIPNHISESLEIIYF
jgi:hypothetical protein